jgi:toxin ParE1/3/4
MRQLRVRALARMDISEAFDWYRERSPESAMEFLRAAEVTLTLILHSPAIYLELRRGIRRALLSGFPYAVYFEMLPEAIVVHGVIHGRRDPGRWAARIDQPTPR